MDDHLAGVMTVPCKTCPYRRDVPSGVWDVSEYEKLPDYDGSIMDQLAAGATGLFMCHQKDGNLCAGWLATHGTDELLAMRLHGGEVKNEVWGYQSPIPVFASGHEACEHGEAGIEKPDAKAKRAISRLLGKHDRS